MGTQIYKTSEGLDGMNVCENNFFTEHFILVLNLMKQILSEENSSVLNAKKKMVTGI